MFSAYRGKISSSPIFCRGGEQTPSPHYPRPFSLLPRPFSLRGPRGSCTVISRCCTSISFADHWRSGRVFCFPPSVLWLVNPSDFDQWEQSGGKKNFFPLRQWSAREIEVQSPKNQTWSGSCPPFALQFSLQIIEKRGVGIQKGDREKWSATKLKCKIWKFD